MCCFNFNFVIKLWEGLYVNFSIVSANHLVRSETPLLTLSTCTGTCVLTHEKVLQRYCVYVGCG